MPDTYDVAVVGAGPAGLAAAVESAAAGLGVVLIDAAGQPGGQYWRHYDESHARPDDLRGHHGRRTFTRLRERLDVLVGAGRIRYLPGHQVWLITRGESGEFTLRLTPATSPATTGAEGDGPSLAEKARALIL